MVLGQIGTPKIINFLKKTIRHPDYRVRKETVDAAARIDTPDSVDFMILALSDPDAKIQMSSLDFLLEKNCTRAFRAVEHLVKDKKFKDRPPEQIKKFVEAYGQLGQDKALPYLKQLALKRLLFGSSKEERLKLITIGALGEIKVQEAARLLSKLSQNKNKKVSAAAMKAMNRQQRNE
jgi:HEAT repeat protein